MTTVFALDIALHRTGWALGSDDGSRPQWGVFETVNFDNDEGGNLCRFTDMLVGLSHGPSVITHMAVEQVFVDVRNPKRFQFNGTEGQMMLKGAALQWAHRNDVKPFSVSTSDWRLRFLGLNCRPKDAAGDEAYWKRLALRRAADLNWYCEHHDEAEALGIMDYTLAALSHAYRLKTNPRLARQHAAIDHKRGDFA